MIDEQVKGIKRYLFALRLKLMAIKNHEKNDPLGALRSIESREIIRFSENNPDVPGVKYHSYGFVMTDEHSDERYSEDYLKLKGMCTHKHEKTPEPLLRNGCIFLAC